MGQDLTMVLTVDYTKSGLNYLQANPRKIPNSKIQTGNYFVEKQIPRAVLLWREQAIV